MDWIILRMAGSRTLAVAHSLAIAGFEVWTPTETQIKRVGRARDRSDLPVAIMPTYVFARATQLVDLIQITKQPVSPHPQFSVFSYHDRFPVVADAELATLKAMERRDMERRAAEAAEALSRSMRLTEGTGVRLDDGPFQGLVGQVVEASRGQFTLVAFPGFALPVKFSTHQLNRLDTDSSVQVQGVKSEQGTAARAA